MNFSAIYRTEPNSAGWFIEEKIVSRNAKLNRNGNLVHDTCLGSDLSKCSSSDISLVAIRDASNYYFRTSDSLIIIIS